jgi:hypothetical protein
MKSNKHLDAIPELALTQAAAKIKEILASISPYMVPLTPTERQEMPKMGSKTLSFVEKAFDFAVDNPSLVPPYLDMDAFRVDFSDAHGLWTLLANVLQLHESLNDTVMTAGSEAFQTALVFYNSVKVAAAQDVVGAAAIYEQLKTRFPGTRRRGETTETETLTETVSKKVSIT